MSPEQLRILLEQVKSGALDPDAAVEQLRSLPYEDMGFAKVDHHRQLRCGSPEVIYGEGKTPEHLAKIALAIVGRGTNLLVTRVDEGRAQAVLEAVPDAVHNPMARTVSAKRGPQPPTPPKPVVVVCAGTSDLPVAQEAVVTAEILGSKVESLTDVGVAGIHRLLTNTDKLRNAGVVVVVAGMEGALPSVVSGLVDVPCVAVPTSVGYGAAMGGLTPLFGMLSSCAPGLTVVNIDNGFGAGYAAAQINRLTLRD